MGQIEKEPSYRKICRKCLLQDMDENEYFTDLRKYIAQIDKDLKVEDEEYQNRLAKCKECEWNVPNLWVFRGNAGSDEEKSLSGS